MSTMKLLVTGAGGMLGQALVPCLKARDHDVCRATERRARRH